MTELEEAEVPAWCVRLHQLADAAREAVLAAGWRVGRVAVVVTPADGGEALPPLVVRAVISTGPAATSTPLPTPCRR